MADRMVDLFAPEQGLPHIPQCIRNPENPNRGEDLMLWTLGHCEATERGKMMHTWLACGSIDSSQAIEIAKIAGLLGDGE